MRISGMTMIAGTRKMVRESYVQDIIDNECHLDLSDGAQEIIDNYDEDGDSNEN